MNDHGSVPAPAASPAPWPAVLLGGSALACAVTAAAASWSVRPLAAAVWLPIQLAGVSLVLTGLFVQPEAAALVADLPPAV